MFKYGGGELFEQLYVIHKKKFILKQIPKEWKQSVTIRIFKKTTKFEPKNYKGISFLSSILKLLTKIIAEEVTQ